MKSTNFSPFFLLLCTIFLFGSCTAYQKAQWPAGNSPTASDVNRQGGYCPHQLNSPNDVGIMPGVSVFSMHNEYSTFCHKCGRYVRGGQQVGGQIRQ